MLNFLNKFKKNYRKYAMTLAEVLMVFAIIGVVASMTLYTAKPFDKNMKYAYAKAYDTLNVAFYNSRTTLPKYLAPQNGHSAAGMNYDWPLTTENFCKMLLEYINFKPEKVKGPSGPNIGGSIPIDQPDNKFSVANCSAKPINVIKSAEVLNNVLRRTPPHFVASNGMKFWIGQTEKEGYSPRTLHAVSNETNSTITMRYFIVLVDLNGDLRPNSVEITDKKLGDIVAFLVTDQNEVIPIGRPEIDRRYLSARVVYNVNIDQSSDASTSNTMTYYEAKRNAWGQQFEDYDFNNVIYTSLSNPMSVNVYTGANSIGSNSVFYQDYTKSPYKEVNNSVTYDMEWCGRKKAVLVDPDNPDAPENFELNPNACYVKITDYF